MKRNYQLFLKALLRDDAREVRMESSEVQTNLIKRRPQINEKVCAETLFYKRGNKKVQQVFFFNDVLILT